MEGKGPGRRAAHCLPPILGVTYGCGDGVRDRVTSHSRHFCFCVCVSPQVRGVGAAPLEMFGWMEVLGRSCDGGVCVCVCVGGGGF